MKLYFIINNYLNPSMITRNSMVLLLVFVIVFPLSAQSNLGYYFNEQPDFNPEIKEPSEILGFQIGDRHVSHEQLVRYMEYLAEKSDRIEIEKYGETYEKRPLLLLTISNPDNLNRIDEIRENHIKLTDPSLSATIDIEEEPAVIWMGYSVHGNEASGANASLLVAYYLAAAQSEELEDMLKKEVILMDPCINPDGYSRFAHWVNQFRSQVKITDPNNIELNEPWPGGRTNHYWFDLNRDWLLVQHPESKARLEKFHSWYPNILTDHHEMGSNNTFFFQPGIPSRNNPITPESTFDLTGKIANYHAEALDRRGSLYYSRESFDDFYYGKGSTYPDVNGGIGILFEQASSRGHARETETGILEFPFSIQNQITVSLSTIKAGYELREELLMHQRKFYKDALDEAGQEPVKAYVFDGQEDKGKMYNFLKIILAHKIKVYNLSSPLSVDGNNYRPESSYILPLSQVQYRLIKSLMKKMTNFNDSLFYDVSAWTLPMAFDINYSEINNKTFQSGLIGQEINELNHPEGELKGVSDYGYLIKWNDFYSPLALNLLHSKGIKTKIARKKFTIENGQQFAEGTIFISVQINDLSSGKLADILKDVAGKSSMDIFPVSTGYTASGINLGSPNMEFIKKPAIMMIVGDGITSYEAGEVWHFLDHKLGIPLSLVHVDVFNKININKYNRIILVNGNYGGINEKGREKLKAWVEGGGNIIALKGGAKWLMDNSLAHIKIKKGSSDSVDHKPYRDLVLDRGAQTIGGSIFKTRLDLSHPLCYGYQDDRLSVFKNGKYFFRKSKNPYNNPVRYTDSPLESGYISEENYERIKGSSGVIISSIGKGRTICFSDNPNFRGFWFGTNRLFINALYFGDLISARSTR